mmetsp:Transcript_18155/g.32742  ORF Transcript_18155/g.32742 Transcript_18155/m.32742 type:complete len:170 (+) Transcript_18155:2-511(+)
MLGCLIYALYLSYITRQYQLSEGTWITASIVSIFQLLILFVPVLFLLKDDTDAFFFVFAGFVFLMSTTITLLMFVPKLFGATPSQSQLVRTSVINSHSFGLWETSTDFAMPTHPRLSGFGPLSGNLDRTPPRAIHEGSALDSEVPALPPLPPTALPSDGESKDSGVITA